MTSLIAHLRTVHCDMDTALGCYLKLNQKASQCFMFESVQGTERWARYSFIGLEAREYYTLCGNQLAHYLDGQLLNRRMVGKPLQAIAELQRAYQLVPHSGLPRFCGGLVGYFGYDCVRYIEPRLAALPELPDPIGAPDAYLLVCRELVAYDNLSNNATIICLHEHGQQVRASARAGEIAARLLAPQPQVAPLGQPRDTDKLLAGLDGTAFKQAVVRCREYIHAGDVFQVVPSHRASYPFSGDVLQLYRALRLVSPSPYMYLLRLAGVDIVGASPETMVRLDHGRLTVRPLAGTAPRGASPQEDQQLAELLLADPKERAEHNMLVDLARNDLGRAGKTGSVRVDQYMQVEHFSHVMHLVSTVTADLAAQFGSIDALCATLPAGTLSGAPKIRAMEIINEMEPVKRSVYSGAVGYLDWRGNLDTAIPIRTFVLAGNQVHIQAGSGIVADSDPDKEWQETLNKRRGLFRALSMVQA